MAGKRARELIVAKKLVAEQSHLLPRMRGSEKRRLIEEEGLAAETVDQIEVPAETGRLLGKEKIRRRVRMRETVDGGVVEEIMEDAAVAGGEDDEFGGFDEDTMEIE